MAAEWDPNAAWELLRTDPDGHVGQAYHEIMSATPVARVEGVFGGFWAALGYEAVVAAALDPATFSNVVPFFHTQRPPLECDPPDHQRYRRLLNPFFSRERMLALEPDVRRMAVTMLEPLLAAGGCDFAESFTHPFPTRVLCRLLGAHDEDWELINAWGRAVDSRGGQTAPGSSERAAAGKEIKPYMLALVRTKRAHPGDDVTSGLLAGAAQAGLDAEKVLGLLMMILSAGHNTTTSAIGNLVLRLAADEGLQDRLRREPALIAQAVEESLRLDAPQQAMRRVATRSTTLAGREIEAGDWVWLVFGAANVDPAAFARPTVFDLKRSERRHLGFGRGIHLCVGGPLARLQLRVVAEELLARTSAIALDGPIERPPWPRRGVDRLPLLLR